MHYGREHQPQGRKRNVSGLREKTKKRFPRAVTSFSKSEERFDYSILVQGHEMKEG